MALPERAAANVFKKAEVEQPKRTLGLKLVDVLIYSINNIGVFGISVGATYLTHRGDQVGAEGSTWRKIGSGLKRRGDWVKEGLIKNFGMNAKRADETKMVVFSFLDGTLLWPFVEKLETKRIPMAKWFDEKFGTTPQDEAIYKIDPHQNNSSILEGRLATSAIVVPTAVALEKTMVKAKDGSRINLNDYMFNRPSEKIAHWLEHHSPIKKNFPKLDIPYLSKTAVFELFYTTVCTLSLYGISRAIAKHNKATKDAVAEYIERQKQSQLPASSQEKAPEEQKPAEIKAEVPEAKITDTAYIARVQTPMGQEITA